MLNIHFSKVPVYFNISNQKRNVYLKAKPQRLCYLNQTKQGCLLALLPLNSVQEVLGKALGHETERRGKKYQEQFVVILYR